MLILFQPNSFMLSNLYEVKNMQKKMHFWTHRNTRNGVKISFFFIYLISQWLYHHIIKHTTALCIYFLPCINWRTICGYEYKAGFKICWNKLLLPKYICVYLFGEYKYIWIQFFLTKTKIFGSHFLEEYQYNFVWGTKHGQIQIWIWI